MRTLADIYIHMAENICWQKACINFVNIYMHIAGSMRELLHTCICIFKHIYVYKQKEVHVYFYVYVYVYMCK